MRRGGRVLIILGLVLALIAGVGVFWVLASAQPGTAEIKRRAVVIAFQPIPERTEIGADQVGIANYPDTGDYPFPAGTFSESKAVIGKLTIAPIAQGQMILPTNLVDREQSKERRSNASYILDKGSVAIALPLTLLTSVANAVVAGDRVDLIATFAASGGPQISTGASAPITGSLMSTQRTLQNLLVLQVGPWPNAAAQTQQSSSQQAAAAGVVTLQVSEQDAQVLKFVEGQSSQWTFVLRPTNDDLLVNPTPVSLDYINRRFGYQLSGSK